MDQITSLAYGFLLLWAVAVLLHGLYRSMTSSLQQEGKTPAKEASSPTSGKH